VNNGACIQDYSGHYGDYENCYFQHTGTAVLHREEFDIEWNENCSFDWVSTNMTDPDSKYCGNASNPDSPQGQIFPQLLQVQGTSHFHFHSDDWSNGTGFKICSEPLSDVTIAFQEVLEAAQKLQELWTKAEQLQKVQMANETAQLKNQIRTALIGVHVGVLLVERNGGERDSEEVKLGVASLSVASLSSMSSSETQEEDEGDSEIQEDDEQDVAEINKYWELAEHNY
jgi:hypothetical protein